ncbi:MAG: hypothetical protein IJ091_07445 [Oscillospiraceae bacterium]|nr:hypothetical protein [Oscillospiraceae bacterium]
MAAKRQVLPVYDFEKPIRITRFRSGGLDILFYSTLLGLITVVMMFLLFWRGGHFVLTFTLGRTLLSFPLAMVAIVLAQMLREIRTYTKELLKKSTWTIEELMKLTGKDKAETERIISRVLEVSFVVDMSCIKNADELS